MRKLPLLMTTALFGAAIVAAPAAMAQNSTGMGQNGAPGSASSDMIQRNPPTYNGGMGGDSAPSSTSGSMSGHYTNQSNLDNSQQDRASASTAAVGRPATASSVATMQSGGADAGVPGTVGSGTTQDLSRSHLGGDQTERGTSSAAAIGHPATAGGAASIQSYHPNTPVIGKGKPGPGVEMPSAMLVPPGASR